MLRLAPHEDTREIPPLLVTSSEGSAMYGTTDLATAGQRRETLAPDLYLYVVDQRQADHFVQVFRAAELAGWAEPHALEHIDSSLCLSMEWFRNRIDADIVIKQFRRQFNEVRAHSSLGQLTPAEFNRQLNVTTNPEKAIS